MNLKAEWALKSSGGLAPKKPHKSSKAAQNLGRPSGSFLNTISQTSPQVIAIVQARCSSERYPGKVMAEFRGKKVVSHALEAAGKACGRENVVCATSEETSDYFLATFLEKEGWNCFRGNLMDVWSRFHDISARTRAQWIVRICADSPLMSSSLIQTMIQLVRPDLDLITNIHPRTFPRGQSVEILHRRLFDEEKYFPNSDADREHVTPHLYRIPGLRLLNYRNSRGDQSNEEWSVEKPGDIERLEKLSHG